MKDWVESKLGEVCNINMGQSPPSSTYNYEGVGLPFFQGKAEFTELYPEIRKWCSKPKKTAEIGDILLSVRAPVGATNIANVKCSIGRGLAAITYQYSGKFLWYYLKSIERELDSKGTGTTFKAISGEQLKSQKIHLPPVTIQRAIANKIEELFSSLDSGIADLKKAQEQLKVYRQAVLTLTENNFPKVSLSNLLSDLSQGWSPKCINQNSTDEDEWAVIKTTAIQPLNFLQFENKVLPKDLQPRKQHEIEEGDILITRAGPRVRVGVCCLVKRTKKKLLNCDKVYRLKVQREKVLPQYLEYALNSPTIQRRIEKMKSGSSDSGLNLTQNRFLTIDIALPQLDQQRKIIQEIDNHFAVCSKIEADIEMSLISSDVLRQSILKKAFEGKLLSEEEIEQCKQEHDYEPARVLLEKIKAEKKK